MATEQEVLSALANLINQQASGSIYQPRSGSDSGTSNRDENQRAKDASKVMSNELTAGMKKSLKMLPQELQKALDKSGNRLVKELAGTTKTLQDVLKADDQIAAMKQITSRLGEIGDQKFESQEQIDAELKELEKIAKSAGMTLDQLGIKIKQSTNIFGKLQYQIEDTEQVIEELKEATEAYTDATDEARAATEKFTSKTQKASQALGTFWKILKNAAEIGEKEIRFAMERATADQGVIKGITELQISQSEYAKILADTRQEQFAMRSVGIDFNKVLSDGTKELQGFTSSNEEAAQVAAQVVKNVSRMGVSQNELEGEVQAQIKAYKQQARAYGISAVEMSKFTESLLADDEYRMQIVRLRGKERAEFVRGIAQRQAEYRQMGYTTERAKEVEKSFAALIGLSPKERMKQAAKQRAMLGALGMGQEGAELQRLKLQIKYEGDAKKRTEMQERITEIQAESSNRFIERTGAGATFGTAMAFEQMAEKTGFTQIAKTFETTSGKGLEHQAAIAKSTQEIPDILKSGIFAKDTYTALTKSGLPSIATGILAAVVGGLGTIITMMLAGAAVKGGEGLMRRTAGMGAAARGVGNSAIGMGKGIGRLSMNVGRAALGPAGMLLGAGAAGYATGTAINNQLSPETKENIGDFVGKSVDSVLSFFGNDEARKRLEIMEAPLMKKEQEMRKAEQKTPAQKAEEEAKVQVRREMIERKKSDVNKLNKTLDELIIYLKEVNGANKEQAKALNKTAEVAEKTLRVNGIPDRRQ